VRGGILIGLVTGTLVAVVIEAIWHLGAASKQPGGWSLSVPTLSGSPFALPDLSLAGYFSLGSFGRIGVLAAVMLVFTLVFANFFDAMGTFTGLAREAGLADAQGTFPRLRSALIVEGAGAIVGGATSSSSNTVFIESGAGIEANLVTGVLFLAAMFVAPLASIVPTEVAAAALVIVGMMMMSQLRHIDISEFSVALPVVLAVATMPFSYSIANGIGVGFIAWVVLRTATGKVREISPLLWIVAAGFLVYFAQLDRVAHRLVTPGASGRHQLQQATAAATASPELLRSAVPGPAPTSRSALRAFPTRGRPPLAPRESPCCPR
jgi:AGZA family xanthine/uracil permease-like MFS transporter